MTAVTRGERVATYTDLVVEDCCTCGVLFGIPAEMERRARRDPRVWFYCPNGHHQHYPGKTEEQKQRERADRLSAQLTSERDQRHAAERSNSALKGVVTRTKRRIGKGVCPCCNRHFANVERHMENQHPEYSETTP